MDAAKAFLTCSQDSLPKQTKELLIRHEAAGGCHSEARDPNSAGDNYRLAELYAKAACTCREGGYFDEMVEVNTRHKDSLVDELRQELMATARMHYFKVYPSGWLVSEYL